MFSFKPINEDIWACHTCLAFSFFLKPFGPLFFFFLLYDLALSRLIGINELDPALSSFPCIHFIFRISKYN